MSVELKNIAKSFNGSNVLDNVSLKIKEGELIGIIGPSSGGKSTLLKVMGGILEHDRGEVHIDPNWEINLMFQEGALFDSITTLDNITFPLTNGKVPVSILDSETKSEVCKKGIELLAKVGLEEAWAKYPAQLSGGMRRRLSLARALVSEPQLALLDDPTAGLDPVASSVIMDLIKQNHKEFNMTTVVVSHDLRRLLPICDRILGLFDGNVSFEGDLEDLRKSNNAALVEFVSPRFKLN